MSSHLSSSISSPTPILLAFSQKVFLHPTNVFVSESHQVSRWISSSIPTVILPTSYLRRMISKCRILEFSQLFFMDFLYLFGGLERFHIFQNLKAFFDTVVVFRKKFLQDAERFFFKLYCTHDVRNLKMQITQGGIIDSRI